MLSLALLSLLIPFSLCAVPLAVQEASFSVYDNVKVPVHLAVQSRDPDALLCENIFDTVIRRVAKKIDLTLVYVAELDDSEPDFGVKCPHDSQECAGNVHQLCVARHASSFAQFWEFIHCSNYQGQARIGKTETALKCANSANIDWNAGTGDCIGDEGHGEEGVALLQESVKLGKQMNINQSCTVLINEVPVCVHDGTWKECEGGHTANDFVRQINNEYERINTQ